MAIHNSLVCTPDAYPSEFRSDVCQPLWSMSNGNHHPIANHVASLILDHFMHCISLLHGSDTLLLVLHTFQRTRQYVQNLRSCPRKFSLKVTVVAKVLSSTKIFYLMISLAKVLTVKMISFLLFNILLYFRSIPSPSNASRPAPKITMWSLPSFMVTLTQPLWLVPLVVPSARTGLNRSLVSQFVTFTPNSPKQSLFVRSIWMALKIWSPPMMLSTFMQKCTYSAYLIATARIDKLDATTSNQMSLGNLAIILSNCLTRAESLSQPIGVPHPTSHGPSSAWFGEGLLSGYFVVKLVNFLSMVLVVEQVDKD